MSVLEAEPSLGARPGGDATSELTTIRRWRPVALAAGWALLVVPFVLEVAAVLRSSHVALIHRLPDDAFYYLEVAARLGRGEGFTFDGVHETNGFHLGWQLVLVPLSWVFEGDALIRAALVVGLVITFAAVVIVVRVVSRWVGPAVALVGAICAVQFSLGEWTNGMEAPVVLLAVAVLLWSLTRAASEATTGRIAAVGAACAFVFLARFDYLVVVGLVPIALAFRLRTWHAVRAWCLGAFSLLAPIGIWWLARWGHVLTTSATVKSTELDRTIESRFGGRFSLDYLDYLGDLATAYVDRLSVWKIGRRLPFGASDRAGLVALANVLALAALATAALGWVTSIRRWARARVHSLGPTAWAVSLVLAMLVVKAVVDLVAAPLWASGWYSAGQRLAVGFVFGAGLVLGVRWCADRFRVVTLAACAALLLFVLPFNVGKPFDVRDTRHTAGWQDQIDLAATWITRQGPPGRYGARDAGLLAHRLDGTRTVVNLDGLVNDYEFAALVEDEASLRARASATSVMFFVGRLSRTDVEQEFGCGVELWRSPELIYYSDSLHGESREPLRIIDLRSCT